MSQEDIDNLGPLAVLAGIWEGKKGMDVSPAPDRGRGTNPYRERMSFEPIGQVDNHEQILYGLRYATTAFRLGEDAAFHEENGYWLWDAKAGQIMRCFIVPRGVTVLAGGQAAADAKSFELVADVGSEIFGICSGPFLDAEFKTVRYELKLTVHDADSFSYEEDTQLRIKGQDEIFHHTDGNTMRRVA